MCEARAAGAASHTLGTLCMEMCVEQLLSRCQVLGFEALVQAAVRGCVEHLVGELLTTSWGLESSKRPHVAQPPRWDIPSMGTIGGQAVTLLFTGSLVVYGRGESKHVHGNGCHSRMRCAS
jgi:hypothetical protein